MSKIGSEEWVAKGHAWLKRLADHITEYGHNGKCHPMRPCSCCRELTLVNSVEELSGIILCPECKKKGPIP